ncbi:uncharacterized protein PITG_20984 [Phytophthora infestans T30-4]|uniref:Fibronectin type-III domain-containing protein n=1 Tax=Phytophthora infestans (strain T30-4) TaxID=403677 RepID=D0P3B8_PHYIT|nr:uncharacterized protein PITG_20984 [Phytophthora infestans T30-4]EEY59306.1 conserved hypothetical protein [Phytophthora infestans T30-4]|eukprot:XP_002895201.1 conserved hypothetical protein [Phytophthora infestans T30-4]
MANRSVNEDFRLVRLVTLPATDVTEKSGTLTLHGLTPTAAYRFRVKALLLDGRGTFSDVVTLRMPTKPRNTWRRCVTRTVDEENTRAGMRVTNTPPLQRFPSARRGHSLTLLDNSLYLFGGMAKSYECSRAHKVPCLLQPSPRSVSNDFWRYDLRTETLVVCAPPALVPSPREKHSMAVVNDRLILFGGRQNDVSDANDASTWGPRALNDLWELSVSSSTAKQTSVSLDSRQPSALSIPDGGQVFALGRKSGSAGGGQLCVVNVSFVSTSSLEALSVFHQLPVAGNWTLELTDTAADGFVGTLDSWDVTFDVAPCVPAFTWTNLSPIATGTAPTARPHLARMGYPVSCYQLSGMHPVTHVKVVRSSNKFKAYKKLEPSLSRRASGTGYGIWYLDSKRDTPSNCPGKLGRSERFMVELKCHQQLRMKRHQGASEVQASRHQLLAHNKSRVAS